MGAVSVVTAVLSATTAIGGAVAKGEAEAGARRLSREETARNAKLARFRRNSIMRVARDRAAGVEAAGRRTAASARAVVGGSGVASDVGSVPNIFAVSEINAAADAERIRASAAEQSFLGEVQQDDFLETMRRSRRAGILGRVGTGLNIAGETFRGAANVFNAAG